MDATLLLNLFIYCQLLYLFNAKTGPQFSIFSENELMLKINS